MGHYIYLLLRLHFYDKEKKKNIKISEIDFQHRKKTLRT